MFDNNYKHNQLDRCPQSSKPSYNVICTVKNRFYNIACEIYEIAISKNWELRERINTYHPVSNPIGNFSFMSYLINEVVDFRGDENTIRDKWH